MNQIHILPSSKSLIHQFRQDLERVKNLKGKRKGKIAMLESLKQSIVIALEQEQRRKELSKIQVKLEQMQTKNNLKQSPALDKSYKNTVKNHSHINWSLEQYCSVSIKFICMNFQKRDFLNGSLYQLQIINRNLANSFQTCKRNLDYQGQYKNIAKHSAANKKLSNLLVEFKSVLSSIHIQYLNFKDFTMCQKARYLLNKKITPFSKKNTPTDSRKGEKKRILGMLDTANENSNQLSINLRCQKV